MLEVDIVDMASRRVEAYIKKSSGKKQKGKSESTSMGLLSKRIMEDTPDEDLDLTARIAEYVQQIRDLKEEVINGRK